jgi:hypothetical protein
MINPMAGLAVGLGGAALTATNAGSGALAGAGAGAAIGTMIAPGVGTAVGAVIGGLAGGISGMLGRDKKLKKEARKAGEKAMENLTDSLAKGLNESFNKALEGPAGTGLERVQSGFTNYRDAIRDSMVEIDNLLISKIDDDNLRSRLTQLRNSGSVLFSDLSQAEFDALLKKPTDALNKMLEQGGVELQAATLVQQSFETKLPFLQRALGLTEDGVLELAQATGENLYDATKSASENVRNMAEGMINNFTEANRAVGDSLAQIQRQFARPREMQQGALAFDETLRNWRDKLDAGALVGQEGVLQTQDMFAAMIPQLIQAKGSEWAAGLEYARMFNLENGTLYSQKGGVLEGQQQTLIDMGLAPQIQQTTDALMQTAGRAVKDIVVSNLAFSELGLGEGQGLAIQQAVASGKLSEEEINKIINYIQTKDLTDKEIAAQLERNIESYVGGGFELTVSKLVPPLDTAADKLATAGDDLKKAASELMGVTDPEAEDTRSPRGIGDTRSNLARTLSSHDALSSSLPGRRTVTSSYRNFNLGSGKSDHFTGNALDLVGDNLVSYRDRVNRSGGFAEFHGGLGKNKHLHVVPSIRPMGDDSTAYVGASTQSSNGSSVTVSNTFNISGVEGSKEELAKFIVTKINSSIRDAKERM